MTDQLIGAHNGLHSEQGGLPGEHPGRSANPVIKVHDVIWLSSRSPTSIRPRRSRGRSGSASRCAPTTSCTCVAATLSRRVC